MLFLAAEESLAEAEFSFGRQAWGLVVRRCQEAVELELSGILAYFGVHYPKNHDQAPLVFRVLRANGINFGNDERKIELVSVDLSRKRGPALHQEEGYDRKTARRAIADAKYVVEKITRLVEQRKK